MMNFFKPTPPLAGQLQLMVDIANCQTFGAVRNWWPTLSSPDMGLYSARLQHAVEPWGNMLHEPWGGDIVHASHDVYETQLKSLKDVVIAEVRPGLDANVMNLFHRRPSKRKLWGAGFSYREDVVRLAESAYESRVISEAPSALMLESALRMQEGKFFNSDLPLGYKIGAIAVILGLGAYAEYVVYNSPEWGPMAKGIMMGIGGAATVYWIKKIVDMLR